MRLREGGAEEWQGPTCLEPRRVVRWAGVVPITSSVCTSSSAGSAAAERVATAEIDSQRTGCVSFRSFLSWWKRRRAASEGAISDCELNEAREAFIKSDATGRGGIEVSELGSLLTAVACWW